MKRTSLSDLTELIPRAALSLSLVHLSACVLFMLGYAFGFGGNIVSLFGADDIFRIGLKDLSYVYLVSVFLPTLVKLHRIRQENPYAIDRVKAIEDADERAAAYKTLRFTRFVVKIITYLIILMLAALALTAFLNDNPLYFIFSTFPLFLVVSLNSESIKSALKIEHRVFEIADLALVLFLSSLAFGAYFGALDKRAEYEELGHKTLFCNDFAIIRGVSDYFIAVQRDDKKSIIDDECKVVFSIDPK